MTIEAVSAGIGATMALAAAMLQSAGSTVSGAPLMVPILSATIGGLMSYAVLRNTVTRMERDVGDMRKEMKAMNDLFRDVLVKIGQLEVRAEARHHP